MSQLTFGFTADAGGSPRGSKPRSAESLAAEAKFRSRLEDLGAVLLEPAWTSKKKPHHVRCAAGHDCYPLPANVNSGAGICRVCAGCDRATAEAVFRATISALGAEVVGEYRDNRTRVHVRCAVGHDCHPLPGKVQQGFGISCQGCRDSASVMAEAAFRVALAELGATLLEPWLGFSAKHRTTCVAGHACMAVPASVKRGQGICRVCVGQDPATAEAAFRAKISALGGVVLGEYGGADGRVHVRCAVGHDCYPTPRGVRRGGVGCLTCAGMDPVDCEARFRARLAELGAEMLGTYINSHTAVSVRCAAGHDCSPAPADVLQGHGICRVCRGAIWDAFYVVTSAVAVKFGVTSGDPRPRLREHARAGFTEVVRLAASLPDSNALDAERAVRAALALAGEQPIQGREYFDISCLGLILDIADSWVCPVTA